MSRTALLLAALSAVGFALSTSLQHVAAGRAPASTVGTHRLLAHLARRPWWVIGQVVAVVSFAAHAFALQLGSLVVVQPVVVSGIVLAVPVRAALGRRLPGVRELGTVALTAVGLALFLVAGAPAPGHRASGLLPAALLVGGAGTAAIATWWATRQRTGERAALWFGVASGILFGLVAGLLKVTTSISGSSPFGFLGQWSTWAVVLVGLSGVAVNQRAYRAARLSASMPVLNIVDVVVAIGFGVAVFGENLAHSPLAILGQVAALVLVATGLHRLGRSELWDEAETPTAAIFPEISTPKGST